MLTTMVVNMIYADRSNLPDDERALLRLGDLVSTAHFRMVAMLQALHRDDHLASSNRGVLRNLIAGGPMTVPEIARLRSASRQFVQRIVDGLAEEGLVARHPNPKNKRSPLIAITEAGLVRVDAMIERERIYLARALLRAGASTNEIGQAARLIERFVAGMDAMLEELGEAGDDPNKDI